MPGGSINSLKSYMNQGYMTRRPCDWIPRPGLANVPTCEDHGFHFRTRRAWSIVSPPPFRRTIAFEPCRSDMRWIQKGISKPVSRH